MGNAVGIKQSRTQFLARGKVQQCCLWVSYPSTNQPLPCQLHVALCRGASSQPTIRIKTKKTTTTTIQPTSPPAQPSASHSLFAAPHSLSQLGPGWPVPLLHPLRLPHSCWQQQRRPCVLACHAARGQPVVCDVITVTPQVIPQVTNACNTQNTKQGIGDKTLLLTKHCFWDKTLLLLQRTVLSSVQLIQTPNGCC